jgi:hypothetical protein
MWLAKNYPEKINRLITLATKFHWDEIIAAKEVKILNAEAMEIGYAKSSGDAHCETAFIFRIHIVVSYNPYCYRNSGIYNKCRFG